MRFSSVYSLHRPILATGTRFRGRAIIGLLALIISLATSIATCQQPTTSIWSPVNDPSGSNAGPCFFRKKCTLIKPEYGELVVAVADRPEIYVNGRYVDLATGVADDQDVVRVDVSTLLQSGVNLIAAKVPAQKSGPNGLALRFRVKEIGEVKWRSLSTDESWLTRNEMQPAWQMNSFDDVTWLRAKTTGQVDLAIVSSSSGEGVVRDTVKGLPISAVDENRTAQPRNQTAWQQASSPARQSFPQQTARESAHQSNDAAKINHNLPTRPQAPSASESASVQSPPADQSISIADKNHVNDNSKANAKAEAPAPPRSVPSGSSNTAVAVPHRQSPQPESTGESEYKLAKDFQLQQLMTAEETGSAIAMAFDEFGKLIISREGDTLIVADLAIPFGQPRTKIICDQVTSCQGLLPLNGKLYVTGSGPEGLGLYVLSKSPSSETYSIEKTLVKFTGTPGEHGPHAVVFGPDGMLYVVIGNHSGIEGKAASTSPLVHCHDADMVPRYEDPGGHAAGIRAPGGTIIRVSLDGTKIETVAGGLRNVYDLAFNSCGDLFVHESDMEADVGLPWYRPTSLYHVPAGADLGWRSGWSHLPASYLDTVKPIAETGRGSPAGMVCYQHVQFPERYKDCLFLADWSEGRIIAARLDRGADGYTAAPEDFLTGKPLNVTDLEVGEDGALYFCTGGRGTQGGVFRVIWKGVSQEASIRYTDNLDRVLRHPQPNSAWARQNIALLRQNIGPTWGESLLKICLDAARPAELRCRALELLHLYGGPIESSQLELLANDSSEAVRAKTAWLLGLIPNTEPILEQRIGDSSNYVKRIACESWMRKSQQISTVKLLPLLATGDANVALATRRLLERAPESQWCSEGITSPNLRVYLNSSVAALNAHPSLALSYDILARAATKMQGFIRDDEFNDLLRVVQLALVRGQVDPEKVPAFCDQLYQEFPTASPLLNRELIRILAYLNVADSEHKFVAYLNSSKDDHESQTLVAMYLAAKSSTLDEETRLAVIDFLERAQTTAGNGTHRLYLSRCVRETAENLTPESHAIVLKNGAKWTDALVPVFYKLPEKCDEETTRNLIALDRTLASVDSDASRHARLGMIALLAQSELEEAMEYLREIWRREQSRRSDIAIGLAQQPNGKNWNYLVASLPILDDLSCLEVMKKLCSVSLRPVEPKYYRQVIELGYRLHDEGADLAAQLLEHWAAESIPQNPEDWKSTLDAWRTWYESKWPQESPVNIHTPPTQPEISANHFNQIMEFLNSGAAGNAERGMTVFHEANCAKCHRVGAVGPSTGPDLTGIAKRYSKRETLEAIIDPSRTVPDRYQSTLVQTVDGEQILGMKVDETNESISLLNSDGQVLSIPKSQIDESKIVSKSSMPSNLIDSLSMEQIGDLFAFMYGSCSATAEEGLSSNPSR